MNRRNHSTFARRAPSPSGYERVATVISQHLLSRYPGDFHRTVAVREFVERVCLRHIELGLADSNFESNLCSGDDARYWQRLSEALLAHELLDANLNLRPSRHGPDFLIQHEGRNIWIEVICPEPTGVPSDWLQSDPGVVTTFPHEAILLRWTAAIKEKAEKLLGNPDNGNVGYVGKGVVAADDPYVIAINGRRLRGKYFSSITGISQFPFAVEAVFAVGPFAIQIDRRTLKAIGSEHQHRPVIQKPNGSEVPAYTFLDPAFRPISAIWATDVDETWAIGNGKSMAVVHNPNAANPIALGLLPAYWDYVALENGNNEYSLERRPGRLKADA
jgi:hypothetical protein